MPSPYRFLALLALLAVAGPARAAFHFSVISEVLTSFDFTGDIQFVEIEMQAGGQTLVANSVLAVFDVDGGYVGDALVVPGNVAAGGAGLHWLMGTLAVEAVTGVAPDFVFPDGALPGGGGMICWGAPGLIPPADPNSWDHADPTNYVDCVAYGTYAGPPNSLTGTPTPLDPDNHSLLRLSDSHDNASDFGCGDPASPTNNAGTTASLPATFPCPSSGGPQARTQAICIAELNRRGAGVTRAQFVENKSCYKQAATGRIAPAEAAGCLAADSRGKLAAAWQKTINGDAAKCAPSLLPTFAYTDPATVNDAAVAQGKALMISLLGPDLGAAIALRDVDIAAFRCQACVVLGAGKLHFDTMKLVHKLKKKALLKKTVVANVSELETAIADGIASSRGLDRKQGAFDRRTLKKCRNAGDLSGLFPGRCIGESTPEGASGCAAAAARCHACLAINAMDALALDCTAADLGSCPP